MSSAVKPPLSRPLLAAVGLTLLLSLFASVASANTAGNNQPGDNRPVSQRDSNAGQSIKLRPKEAAALAKRRHGGKVIGIRREGSHYKVRLMKEGRVREVSIPVRLKR